MNIPALVEEKASIYMFNTDSLTGELSAAMKKQLEGDRVKPLESILGLDKARNLLRLNILAPLKNTALYPPPFEKPRLLCIYGRQGSGKRSLVLSYCRQHRINVILVDDSYHCSDWVELLMLAARAIRPCVILFDGCDYHFGSGNHQSDNWSVQVSHFLPHLLSGAQGQQVWLVLASGIIPMAMHATLSSKIGKNCAYAEPLEQENKLEMFKRVFSECYGSRSWEGDVYGSFIAKVVQDYSECVNFGDVYWYAQSLYTERLSEMDDNTLLKVRVHDPRHMPSKHALDKELQLLTCTKRITTQDPMQAHQHFLQQECL